MKNSKFSTLILIYQGGKSPGFWLFWAKSQQSVLNWLSEHEYQFESVGHTNTVCSAVMRIESQTLAKPNSPKYRRVLLEVQRQVHIQTCLQTMMNLWWIVKHSFPQIVAESTPTAEFRFWSCEGKKFEAFDELKHTNSFETCSDRPQIMWITSTFYACYIERYDVEQFAALVDLQDFFIWSDPHATDAIFLQGFFMMTVPKGMMIMIYMMNVMMVMNVMIPMMIKILHPAVAIAFALYLMLQLALGWNEKKMKTIKIQWWQSWGGAS